MSNNERPNGAMPPKGMGKPPAMKLDTTALKRLLSYLGRYKLRLFFVFICILTSAIVNVASSLFIGSIIDDYIKPLLLLPNPSFDGLRQAITVMAVVFVIGALAAFAYNRTMVTVAQGILKSIRDEMFEKMQKLPIRYFDTHTHGDILSHYTNDTDTLRQMIAQSLPQMISSAMTVIAVFVAMLTTSIPLTAFVVVFVFLMLTLTKKITGQSGKFFVRQQKSIGDVNGYIEEMINGQKTIKVFCHEEKAKEGFDVKNDELCYNATEANRFANILMPIMGNLGNLQYILIAILGGYLAVNGIGGLTLGKISSFLLLSKSFINPINQVSQQVNMIIMAIAGAGRIFNLMDQTPEDYSGSVRLVNAKYDENGNLCESSERTGIWAWKTEGTVPQYTLLQGDVRFEDVDFEYEKGKPVLKGIKLYAEPGQKVAFVGATGAGKTTITNLINRFYEVDGVITYDGIDIKKIHKDDLRRSLGVILQDVNLFTGTVMDNIRYGKLDATDEECIAAAKLANAHNFIEMLPEGYNTMLTGDGSGLSQGQRQLISIARAAVADPPVMIMDEATSSIDTRTEALVQQGMDGLMHGRTVFVIAHRLSTVRNSDVIMVLDHGEIIERGSHDDLIAKKGTYYKLYTGAFELE